MFHVMDLLNSNIFIGIATILTGAAAILIFYIQKWNQKRDAALIILMEIRGAEEAIREIKNVGKIEGITILSTNSWVKFNHLFVQDFDRDELDLINNFYKGCLLAEEELKRLKNMFDVVLESKVQAIFPTIMELAKKYKEKDCDLNLKPDSEFMKEKNKILETYYKDSTTFEPDTPKQRLILYIANIELIINSSVGQKLKKIAKVTRE